MTTPSSGGLVPKKKRKLDQFLNARNKNQESVLVERTQLANRLFRFAVAVILTFLLAVLARPRDAAYSIGLAAFLATLTVLGGLCLHRLQPGVFGRPSSFNKFVFWILLTVGLYRFAIFMSWSPLLVPLPMFAMVAALAYSDVTALVSVLALSFIIGLTSPRADLIPLADGGSGVPLSIRLDFPLAVVVAAGSVVAVLGVRRVREQSKPVLVGFYSGVVQALVAFSMELMGAGASLKEVGEPLRLQALLRDPGWAFLGGVISGAIVTCLLRPIERFFDFVTDRRLLELADPSNDILRVLRQRAPGTYQHTLNVSHLASDAAEAIGGDRLLAEVGALYHDIGKIYKPEYFVENMGADRTVHDRLRPSMSKMIIVSHVKDGIALSEDERLPRKITDMIPMHHGTTVVEYFYQKARRSAAEEEAPEETDYRYPGPKPHFREAGILMLADMVEAIAKSESQPNPSRFRAMVHDQILKRLLDGQLDESDLTLNDLRMIEDSFVRTLTNMYHGRIKYPKQEEESGGAPPQAPSSEEGGGPRPAPGAPTLDSGRFRRSAAF